MCIFTSFLSRVATKPGIVEKPDKAKKTWKNYGFIKFWKKPGVLDKNHSKTWNFKQF